MSFGLPSFDLKKDSYVVPNPMVSGLFRGRQRIGCSHPLEASEFNYKKHGDCMDMILLRYSQGLHAPFRLAMELKAANKIGRHPFLPSSNVMKDIILGRDKEIGFEDTLNTPEFREQMGQPHAILEKNLGIL